MREPRVLHISPTYFAPESVVGGAERYVQGLATAMSARVPTTFVSFGPRPFQTTLSDLQFRVYKPLLNLKKSVLNPLDLRFLTEVAKHDIIHCHQIYTVATEMALLAGLLLRKRVFLTDHGGGGRTYLMQRGLRAMANGFLTVSKYSARGQNAQVIYGGIDLTKFKPNPQIKRIGGRIVAVGRLLPHKGFHHLIEAIGSDELIIAGRSSDDTYLSFLKQHIRSKNVQFILNPSDEKIIELICSAQLAVFPSTRYGINNARLSGEPELFGQAPLEAMACETPALVSDIGSYPEIALTGTPELIFEDGNQTQLQTKLRQLMQDPNACLTLGKRAREHVAGQFTWDITVERCLKAYRS